MRPSQLARLLREVADAYHDTYGASRDQQPTLTTTGRTLKSTWITHGSSTAPAVSAAGAVPCHLDAQDMSVRQDLAYPSVTDALRSVSKLSLGQQVVKTMTSSGPNVELRVATRLPDPASVFDDLVPKHLTRRSIKICPGQAREIGRPRRAAYGDQSGPPRP